MQRKCRKHIQKPSIMQMKLFTVLGAFLQAPPPPPLPPLAEVHPPVNYPVKFAPDALPTGKFSS